MKRTLLQGLGWLDVTEVNLGAFYSVPEHVRQKKSYHWVRDEDRPIVFCLT